MILTVIIVKNDDSKSKITKNDVYNAISKVVKSEITKNNVSNSNWIRLIIIIEQNNRLHYKTINLKSNSN